MLCRPAPSPTSSGGLVHSKTSSSPVITIQPVVSLGKLNPLDYAVKPFPKKPKVRIINVQARRCWQHTWGKATGTGPITWQRDHVRFDGVTREVSVVCRKWKRDSGPHTRYRPAVVWEDGTSFPRPCCHVFIVNKLRHISPWEGGKNSVSLACRQNCCVREAE